MGNHSDHLLDSPTNAARLSGAVDRAQSTLSNVSMTLNSKTVSELPGGLWLLRMENDEFTLLYPTAVVASVGRLYGETIARLDRDVGRAREDAERALRLNRSNVEHYRGELAVRDAGIERRDEEIKKLKRRLRRRRA